MTQRIAIVGAGILGRLLAWQLLRRCRTQQQSIAITVFSATPLAQTGAPSFTAAGMLTPYSELADADALIFDLGMASLRHWPDIAASMPSDIGFNHGGSLVVSHAADKPCFQQFEQQLSRKLGSTSAIHRLDKPLLHEASPSLSERFNEAIYLPQEAWVNSQATMHALHTALVSSPEISLREGESVAPASLRGEFDTVFDCRGLSARGGEHALRGVRGEVVWLRAPQVRLTQLVRLMHPRYKLYIVPRPNDTYILGASQLESEFGGNITVRSALELLSAAYSVSSGFSEAEIIKTDANLRPAYPDNQPQINHHDGLIAINGLFRHGYLLSPVMAEIAIDIALQGESSHPLAAQLLRENICDV